MENNSSLRSAPPATSVDRRRVSREMVQARTHELALIAGRPEPYVSQADYEQAKRELTGESDPDRQNAILA